MANSFGVEYARQLGWAAIKPISFGAIGALALYGQEELRKSQWMKDQLAAAKAADEAYQAELLRAYKYTYPEDTNITRSELIEFSETARGIDDTFRESNFEYQNHIYKKMMELYGSPQGALEDTYNASLLNPGELALGMTGIVALVALGIAAFTAIRAPFKAYNRANGWW